MNLLHRHNVTFAGGENAPPMVFAHGFGCDQHTWRSVVPAFADQYRIVLFDYVGAGGSDLSAYDSRRYAALDGYAQDLVELIESLDVGPVVFVGHSVSAMIGALAAAAAPQLFDRIVMVGPSARYIDDGDYVGGFSAADIDELLDSLDHNYLGWSRAMAPVIMGNPHDPSLGTELTDSFCRTDPAVARQFAEVTFTSDNRADLERVGHPTLVLQCREDVIAPLSAGEYVRDHLVRPTFVQLQATGHCPHLSAPGETVAAIAAFLNAHD